MHNVIAELRRTLNGLFIKPESVKVTLEFDRLADAAKAASDMMSALDAHIRIDPFVIKPMKYMGIPFEFTVRPEPQPAAWSYEVYTSDHEWFKVASVNRPTPGPNVRNVVALWPKDV